MDKEEVDKFLSDKLSGLSSILTENDTGTPSLKDYRKIGISVPDSVGMRTYAEGREFIERFPHVFDEFRNDPNNHTVFVFYSQDRGRLALSVDWYMGAMESVFADCGAAHCFRYTAAAYGSLDYPDVSYSLAYGEAIHRSTQ